MWRLNWKADQSPWGLGNSCGIMVNYRQVLNHFVIIIVIFINVMGISYPWTTVLDKMYASYNDLRYFLDATEENSATYLENQTIQASEQIQQLARQAAGKENNPENNSI